jgi:hypothetical protein
VPVRGVSDMDVVKLLDQKHSVVLYKLYDEHKDHVIMYAHYFNRLSIYIQIIGHVPDTAVFIKHEGRSVCVSAAVEEMIKKKFLK